MDNYSVRNTTRWERVAQLHRDAHADLLRYLVNRIPGPDADDVAQECYLRIHRCENLLTLDNPKAFLFRIATNLLTDRARQRSRHSRSRQLMGEPICTDGAEDAPSPQPTLEDSIVATEELQMVLVAIDVLPSKCRQALLMQRIDGLTHEQIAGALQVSKSMVEKYIAKALCVLRKVLQ